VQSTIFDGNLHETMYKSYITNIIPQFNLGKAQPVDIQYNTKNRDQLNTRNS